MPAPLLIILPHGLNASGVTLWAVRLAGALAGDGRRVGLLLHREPAGQRRLAISPPPHVRVFDRRDLPPLGDEPVDQAALVRAYGEAITAMAEESDVPVIVSPNLHGECYGAAVAVASRESSRVRLIGWQHSDIAYDTQVLVHYEGALSRFVGVSDAIESRLRSRLSQRARDIVNIPYGVEVPAHPPQRDALDGSRPVRLVYTGRLEHAQKRISAMIHMSDALVQRGVRHELVIVGDGPAAPAMYTAAALRPAITLLGAQPPHRVVAELDRADIFVLASRYEGLSVSLLEAMARGCVPVVTRTTSGAAQAIAPGESGDIADVAPDADEATAGEALAEAVTRTMSCNIESMSTAAWRTARQRFSLEVHTTAVATMLDAVARESPRAWPAHRACEFNPSDGTTCGTVPADAAVRLSGVLAALAGRRVILHGAGRHTQRLADVIARSPANIIAIADDDPQRHGQMCLGHAVIAPARAASLGATDVVISSWLHEDDIWARRAMYTSQGLIVHRVYGENLIHDETRPAAA